MVFRSVVCAGHRYLKIMLRLNLLLGSYSYLPVWSVQLNGYDLNFNDSKTNKRVNNVRLNQMTLLMKIE